MATEKLFYQNQYLSQFTAKVTGCFQDKKGFGIVLDQTAFYPEGGGQPFDTGVLSFSDNKVEIFAVHEKNEEIYHYANRPVEVGTEVEGTIDFERRFSLMQQHTGEHMLSGVIHSQFGYDNVGFHLTDKEMSIDVSGPMTKEQIQQCVDTVNEEILKNTPVVAGYPDISAVEYRSKKELSGKVRIVSAGACDTCACCGVHVAATGQVGLVVCTDSMNYKGGTRIYFACGNRAIKDYIAKNENCYKISALLSCKTENVAAAVENKIKETDSLKGEINFLKDRLYSAWADSVTAGEYAFAEKPDLTPGDLQKFAQKLREKCQTVCVVSLLENSGKICIMSDKFDTNALGREICNNFGGKGGGKPGVFQGTIERTEGVKEFFEKAVKL